MSRSKKWRLEWAFFLGENGRRQYNHICKKCVHGCKQSFRACLVACPHYSSKRSKGNRTPSPSEDAYEMLGRIEAALGDEYKKQSMTELVATIQYGDNDGNTINYYILKTTYYEADPAEITGLNTEAIMLIVGPGTADICQEMKIQDWDAALYERGELSYLCWTYSPEVSYILEYSPYAFADEEIIKMAESAKPINEE